MTGSQGAIMRMEIGWLRSALCLVAALAAVACNDETVDPPPQTAPPLTVVDAERTPDGRYLLDFGRVGPGGAQRTLAFVLRNPGAAARRVASSSVAPPFAVKPGSELLVEGGADAALTFSFAPEQEGVNFQEVELRYDGGTFRLILTGEGAAPIHCARDAIDFGNVPVKGTARGSVVCSNRSSIPVQVETGSMQGEGASHFSTLLPRGLRAAPDESFEIEVGFQSGPEAGERKAALPVRVDGRPTGLISLRAVAVESLVEVVPGCAAGGVDFGYVAPGGTAVRTITLRNIGSEPLGIDHLQPDGASEFQVLTPAPLVLSSDDPRTSGRENEVEVRIAFAPTAIGPQAGEISIDSDDAGSTPVVACVRGHGGGPRLSCTPGSLDFGAVPIGMPVTRTLTCTNAGHEVEGTTKDNLVVEELSTAGIFSAVLVNEDGSTGPRSAGYAAGESFEVRVTFDPQASVVAEDEVSIRSNDALEAEQTFRVSGNGAAMPPCSFAVVPPALDFGLVKRGESAVLDFAVRNLSEEACVIHGLRLAGPDGSRFSLQEGDAGDHLLAGNEERRFALRYAAPHGGDGSANSAEVRFEISDPERRSQVVPVRAVSGTSCLVAVPGSLDLGTAALSCATDPKAFRLYNSCSSMISVSSLGVTASASCTDAGCPFGVVDAPELPALVPPNGWIDVTVAYASGTTGSDLAALQAEVAGENEPVFVQLRGSSSADGFRSDRFTVPSRPKVDVLWVLDDSCHSTQHGYLADNFGYFLAAAQAARADFHLGITTTNTDYGPRGRLVPVDGSRPRILHQNTPDLQAVWAANTQVGTAGSATEKGLLGARLALGPGLIDVADVPDTPEPNDGNLGFLRHDAKLTIIFMSGAQDSDTTPTSEYLAFFREVKGVDRPELLQVHAIAPDIPTPENPSGGCPNDGGDGHGGRYHDLVEATGGLFRSFCSPDWGQVLAELGTATFGGAPIYALTNRPQCTNCDEEIVVRLAGAPSPAVLNGVRRWRYDAEQNAIVFVPSYRPTEGTDVVIEYTVACN